METVGVIAWALWAMLPAYIPNNAAVLAGGGRPIDGGRTWGGRRVLGDGKTWRGTLVGTLAGTLLAVLLTELAPSASAMLGHDLPTFPIFAGVGLAFGAMLGDIGASFLKRRSGRKRGAAFPGLDQLDFVVGALLCAFAAAPTWFVETFLTERFAIPVLLVVLVATPILHVVTNGIAYLFGLKNEPW